MFKYNMGGSVPRETNIAGQRHSLAYINPFEEDLLNTQYRGGEGQPVPPFAGPGGVPAYNPNDQGQKRRTKNEAASAFNDSRARTEQMMDSMMRDVNRDNNQQAGTVRSVAEVEAATQIRNAAPVALSSVALSSGVPDQIRNAAPVAPTATVGRPQARPVNINNPRNVSSAGGVATGLSAKELRDARQEKGRSALELFANTITPNDFMEYNLFGELVYMPGHPRVIDDPNVNAGDPVRSDETNQFGFTVGMGNTNTNDADPGMYRGGFGSGVKTDLDMTFAAGFGTPIEQKKALLRAGYTEEMADEFLAQTAASRANMGTGTGMGGDGGGDGGNTNDIVQDLVTGIADPCPEGYKMDPVTNACVIDTDIGIGGPVFTPQDPNAAVGGGSGYTQPVGNFIPTPLQPTPMNPVQQQLNALTSALQPKQNPQMQAGLGALPRRA